jgi:hypothetical protein
MVATTTPQVAFGFVVTWVGHDIGFITDIKPPKIKADVVDFSNHDSADRSKDFGVGLIDGGEVSITARRITGDTTGQKYFLTDLQSATPTSRQVIITYPDGVSKWTFNALATGWDEDDPFAQNQDVTLTMKVTGKPAFTNS